MIKRYRGQKGQTLVEYALLLMVAVLVATAYFQLDDTLRSKLSLVATDFVQTIPGLPYEVPPIIDKEDLSPPVADFTVPEPNYKGRDIRLVNRSFDTDGVVEHYIWNINGVEHRQSRFEAERDDGLVVSFRYSGDYTASLIVIDNDGLVSNMVTKTIRVVNRPPTLSMTVTGQDGQTASMGGTIEVPKGCQATFDTTYNDPDLPYEELTLFSRFTDYSGVRTEYNTVNNQFTRTFYNTGRNEYFVRITDEDNATASGKVFVDVVENPTGHCGTHTVDTKPDYTIEVTGYIDKDETQFPRVYYFRPNQTATLQAVVNWGTYDAHSTPHFWTTTGWDNTSQWLNREIIQRPYERVFRVDDEPYIVEGMARDASAVSEEPDPSLRGMSNQDSVRLEVLCDPSIPECSNPPIPVIAVNRVESSKTPPNPSLLELPVGANFNSDYPYSNQSYTLVINSRDSYSRTGGDISGVRYFIPDKNVPGGGRWYPVNNVAADNYGNGNAIRIEDVNGNEEWWFPLTPDSPDTAFGRVFRLGEGPDGGLNDEWTYQLNVIDSNGIVSTQPAVKTIRLTEELTPPTAVCTYPSGGPPATITSDENLDGKLNANNSIDGEGNKPIEARWKMSGQSWSSWQSISNSPPSSWSFTEGMHQIELMVRDRHNQESPVVHCNVEVNTPQLPPLHVEFWNIHNRIQHRSIPISVQNATTPQSAVAEVRWHYTTEPHISPSGVDHTTGWRDGHIDYTPTHLDLNVQNGVVVTIWVTDHNGNPTCGNYSSYGNISGDSRTWCRKETSYIRTDELWIDYEFFNQPFRCPIQTIGPQFKTVKDYTERWTWLKRESYWEDGKEIFLTSIIQDDLTPDIEDCVYNP